MSEARSLGTSLAAIWLVLGFSTLASPCTFGATSWTWNPKEKKRIEVLKAAVQKEEAFFVSSLGAWNVRSDVSAQFTAEAAAFIELFNQCFNEVFKPKAPLLIKEKPTLVIFKNKAAYDKKFSDGSRGQYQYTWKRDSGWKTFHVYSFIKEKKELDFKAFYHPILMHEGTHLLVRRYFGTIKIPVWFDEGLATYFQYWDPRTSSPTNFKNRYRRSPYRLILGKHLKKKGTSLPSLNTLLSRNERTFNPDKMGKKAYLNYAQAENLMEFIIATNEGRAFFGKMFARLLKGQTPINTTERKRLEPFWHSYMKRTTK